MDSSLRQLVEFLGGSRWINICARAREVITLIIYGFKIFCQFISPDWASDRRSAAKKPLCRGPRLRILGSMKKVALETVGCRLNQYETERLAEKLTGLGLERVSYKEKADLYVLNTCTVTGRADADCRKLINRARRLNNEAAIIVAGCYAVSRPDEIAGLDGVDLIIGNDRKMKIPEILQDRFPELFENGMALSSPHEIESPTHEYPATNRALVKIGDGCNQFCSYCIVPRVRGGLVSFDPDDINREIQGLVAEGYHETVLTAVHIGRYQHGGLDLFGLIKRVLDETDLPRLRLSSLEPNELDNRLLAMVADNPRVCRHLHLPLQSGSNRILKMMRRPYRRDDYLGLVRNVKSANPNITVGCDLIVGFPGETEEDFADSLDILDSGCIDYGHIFSYSDRPGTASSEFPDKVDPSEIKDRNRRVRDICGRRRRMQMKSQIGKELPVISERTPNRSGGFNGISDNYLKVQLPLSVGGTKNIITFKATKLQGDRLEGDIVRQ
jgi:threonylcarbamoyladenosine tRNA methylthiotransferase MtaB